MPGSGAAEAKSIVLSIDGGRVRSVRSYQVRSFEIIVAQASNDNGRHVVFASVPAEANHETQQLRGVLHDLGATRTTPMTILSDGAEERQEGAGLVDVVEEHIRWRLWHGQVQRALHLIGETLGLLEATAKDTTSPVAAVTGKVAEQLWSLETYVAGQAEIIIDYATARRLGLVRE